MSLTKAQLEALNVSSFPNNNEGLITPEILRVYNSSSIAATVNQDVYTTESASFDSRIIAASGSTINTGSFATTGSNTFVGNQTINGNLTVSQSKSIILGDDASIVTNKIGDGRNILTINSNKGLNISNATTGAFEISQAGPSKIIMSHIGGGSAEISGSSTIIQDVSFIPFSASLNSRILAATGSGGGNVSVQEEGTILGDATSFNFLGAGVTASFSAGTASITITGGGGSIDTGSFAVTSSNAFTGQQTLTDVDKLNQITLGQQSGSLVLFGKGFTSSSLANITASSAAAANIIFKNNNNTPTTIVSGSSNIFTNPAAATATFNRYIGGSNNIINSTNTPQISQSMAFSPTMANNYINAAVTMRGPVSSSAWTISNNIVNFALNVGNSTANEAAKAVAGVTITSNIFNNTMNIIANKSLLTQPVSITNNQTAFQATTLTLASSSIVYGSNVGGITITNSASGSAVSVASQSNAIYVNANLFAGTGHTITATGSADAGDLSGNSYLRHIEGNQIFGQSNGVNLPYAETGSNSLNQTIIAGYNLGVTGSNASSFSGLAFNQGSAFFGRYNAQTGNSAQSAQTVFAVGTGTSTSNRKTAFLIDSSSVVNVSGSLSVTGSSTFNGNMILTGSLSVTGSSTFNGTLSVTSSNFSINSGNVTASTILITSSPGFPGGVTITGSLSVSGSTTLSGSLKISASSDIVLNGTLTITGSNINIDSSANVTASAFTAIQGNTKAFSYQAASSGGVNGTFNTALGRDYLDIYQYQGQAYAFAMHLTSDQLNTYSGSQFNFQLQTNGNGVSLPDGGSTYFAMVSASYSSSVGPGTPVPGLDVLGTAMFLDMKARTTFEQKVYMDKGLYVSQSGGGSTAALTINTNGGNALSATGSVKITGSLEVNGQQSFASLDSNTFTNTQIVSSSIYIAPNNNNNQLYLPSGSNKQTGLATLDGGNPGAVTVSNTNVTANSIIMLTKQTLTNAHMVAVSSKGSNTFTITSNGNGDADVVAFMIINPS